MLKLNPASSLHSSRRYEELIVDSASVKSYASIVTVLFLMSAIEDKMFL